MGWTGVLYWLLPRRLRSWWLVLAVNSFGKASFLRVKDRVPLANLRQVQIEVA